MDATDVETAVTMEMAAAAVAVAAAETETAVGITATVRPFATVSVMDTRKDSVTVLIPQMTTDSRFRAAGLVDLEDLVVPADLAAAIAEAVVTEVVAVAATIKSAHPIDWLNVHQIC